MSNEILSWTLMFVMVWNLVLTLMTGSDIDSLKNRVKALEEREGKHVL